MLILKMPDSFFRKLNPEEEAQFRRYAQENDPPDMNQWGVYHPICREEWEKRGISPKEKV